MQHRKSISWVPIVGMLLDGLGMIGDEFDEVSILESFRANLEIVLRSTSLLLDVGLIA